MKNTHKKYNATSFHQKAEELHNKRTFDAGSGTTESDTLKLIHELKVYQIELEMQNEEMVMIKEKAETEAKKYTSLYDCAPSGYFTLSGDGNISELNIAASQMLGKERAQLINARFGFFVSDDTLSSFNAFLKNIFISNVKESCDVTLTTNNNRPQSVHVTGISSENGGQCYITAVNITDRKLAEEALQKSETHYRTLFEKATDGIMYLSLDSEIAKVNESFAKMHGYTVDEMQNMSLKDLDTPETSGRVSERISRLMSGETLCFEVEHYHKNGHTIQLEVSANLITVGNEKNIQSFHRDITDRKKAVEALIDSEDKFKYVFEYSVIGKSITQINGETKVNIAFCNMVGYSPMEMQNIKWQEITYPDDIELTQKHIVSLVFGEKESVRFEKRFVRKNGSIIWVDLSSSIRRDKQNNAKYLLSAMINITERKQAEEALKRTTGILTERVKELHCLYTISDLLRRENISQEIMWLECANLLAQSYRFYQNAACRIIMEGREYCTSNYKKTEWSQSRVINVQGKQIGSIEVCYLEKRPEENDGLFLPEEEELFTTVANLMEKSTERKQAEERLKESELALKIAQSVARIGSWKWHIKEGKVFWSDEMYRIFFIDKKTFTGPLEDVIIKTMHPEDLHIVSNAEELAKNIPMEYRIILPDTSIRNIYSQTGDPILDTEGKPVFLTGIAQDITERKQAEEKLRNNEERLQSLFANMTEGFSIQDVLCDAAGKPFDLRFVDANPAFERQTGLKNADTLGHTLRELFPTSEQYWIDRYGKVGITGEPTSFEAMFGPLNIYYNVNAFQTKPGQLGVMFTDINERKQAEIQLHTITERLHLASSSAKAGVWDWNLQTNEMIWDDRMCELYGLSREIFSGRIDAWEKGLHPEDALRAFEECQQAIRGEREFDTEFRIIHPNGEVVHIKANGLVIRDENGKPVRMIGLNIDITDRKLLEEKLQGKDIQFRKLSANVSDMIYQFTRRSDGKYFVPIASEGIKNIFGCSPEDVIEDFTPIFRVIYPEDTERLISDIEYSAEHLTFFSCEFRVQVPGKPIQWIYSRSTPEKLSDGSITWYGFNANITERKQTEEALTLTRISVETASDSLFWMKPNGKIVDVNEAACRSLGYTREELLQLSVHDVDAHYSAEVWAQHFPALRKYGTLKFESEQRAKDGRLIPVEIVADYIRQGDEEYNCAFVRDITERKKSEVALKESEAKYKQLYESNQMPIAIFDAETLKFLSVNNAFIEKYGYTREEFSTMTILEIRPDSEIERVKQSVILIDKGLVNLCEYLHKKKNGEIIEVEIIRYDLVFEGKNAKLVFANDITERKNTELALRHAQKLESIGTLAGGIAHDFNNLMNAVLGQSALALNKLAKESPAVDNIEKAIKASERVADLTKQLLAYSGRGKFFIVEIDLNNLINENVQMLEVSLPKTTQFRYEPGSPSLHMKGDISQIQQVIMNVIINAGEAMGSNPGLITLYTNRIEIKKETNEYSKYTSVPLAAGSYALLQVKDTGSGISEETLTRIFDPFFTTKFTGRGLGLAAVLGIIKGHKGGLRIESEVGKGTTFEIVFPLIDPSKTTEVSEKEKLSIVNGKGKTILVIDDEASVIELLEDVLPEVNFKVISALDPLKGIELYRQHHQNISLVILDYSMPHMDGKAAFEKLLQINMEVKVLLCSGYSEEETLLEFGVDRPTGYFQKPYKTDALIQLVAEIVSKDR